MPTRKREVEALVRNGISPTGGATLPSSARSSRTRQSVHRTAIERVAACCLRAPHRDWAAARSATALNGAQIHTVLCEESLRQGSASNGCPAKWQGKCSLSRVERSTG